LIEPLTFASDLLAIFPLAIRPIHPASNQFFNIQTPKSSRNYKYLDYEHYLAQGHQIQRPSPLSVAFEAPRHSP